jgi:transcriptional regulator with XRE-family HTH domain
MALKMNAALGHVIREIRTERGLTMREVCRKANVGLGYVSEVERGDKEPSSYMLECLAGALEVPVWEIVYGASKVMAEYEGADFRAGVALAA